MISVAVLIVILSTPAELSGSSTSMLDVTSFFEIQTNSTCGGEPPTLFLARSGTFLNCSLGEYNASLAVDGDLNTWWQSQNGDDPVAVTFSKPMVRDREDTFINFVGVSVEWFVMLNIIVGIILHPE